MPLEKEHPKLSPTRGAEIGKPRSVGFFEVQGGFTLPPLDPKVAAKSSLGRVPPLPPHRILFQDQGSGGVELALCVS